MSGTHIHLSELDGSARLVVTCRCCGQSRFESPRALMRVGRLRSIDLQQLEAALSCLNRKCRGQVSVALEGAPQGLRGAA